MKSIELDLWKSKTVQERHAILNEANAPPTIISLFIQVVQKWLYDEPKTPPLLNTEIFAKHQNSFEWRKQHG